MQIGQDWTHGVAPACGGIWQEPSSSVFQLSLVSDHFKSRDLSKAALGTFGVLPVGMSQLSQSGLKNISGTRMRMHSMNLSWMMIMSMGKPAQSFYLQ